MGTPNARNRPFPSRIRTLQFVLLILVSIISYGALVLPQAVRPAVSQIQVGEVSPSDYQAPNTDSYISEVSTELKRQEAENAVPLIYSPPDPTIARRQIERLRLALQYITLVRADPNASLQQKTDDLSALSDVALQPQTIQQILALTPASWDSIQQESLNVLEQIMRRSIRDQELDSVLRSIPSFVSLSLDDTQAPPPSSRIPRPRPRSSPRRRRPRRLCARRPSPPSRKRRCRTACASWSSRAGRSRSFRYRSPSPPGRSSTRPGRRDSRA